LEEALFELIDDITAIEVYRIVTSLIERNEPRVTIDNATTTVTPDPDNHQYILKLVFQIKGFGTQKFELNGKITKPE
jgi:predicted component of type VI protein secretion system